MKAINIVIGLAILANSNSTFSQAVVSLEAEVRNGVPIPGGPVATVTAAPGDVLELIFRVRSWGTTPPPNNLKGYECAVRFEEYFNECSGDILPVGFYDFTDPTHVCPDGEPIGTGNWNSAYIDGTHPGFVYAGHADVGQTFPIWCTYYWVAVLINTSAPDPGGSAGGVREYMGTLVVRVSDDASGTFVIHPDPDPIQGTFLRNQANLPILPLLLEPCTIIVSANASIVSTNPVNGAIDARQPHNIHNADDLQGWDSLTLHFDHEGCAPLALTINDFSLSVEPPDAETPEIIAIAIDDYDVELYFDLPIPAGHWTRVTYWPNGTNICLGSLPGDVDNNRTASPVDILKLIDALNSLTTYQSFQTDIDRSGVTNPADILREIDLLNGADAFEAWNWRTLPPNPCMP